MKITRTPTFANASAGRQNLIAIALVGALAITTTIAHAALAAEALAAVADALPS